MSDLHVEALLDEGLGNQAYLVDLGDGRALVVDPSLDLRAVDALAARRGLRIAYAAETHLHADFLSGALRAVAPRRGSRRSARRPAARRFEHLPARRRGRGRSGWADAARLATPGHTDEHLSYLLVDGDRPGGGVHRRVADRGRRGAHRPAGAGADRAAGPGAVPLAAPPRRRCPTTRPCTRPTAPGRSARPRPAPTGPRRSGGRRRRTRCCAIADEDAFVEALLASLGSYPPYFPRLGAINRRGPPIPARPTSPRSASPTVVAAAPRGRRGRRRPPDRRLRGRPPARVDLDPAARRCSRPGWAGCCPTRAPRWSSCATPTRTPTRSSGRPARSATTTSPASWPAAWPPGPPTAARCATTRLADPATVDPATRRRRPPARGVRAPGTCPARANVELGAARRPSARPARRTAGDRCAGTANAPRPRASLLERAGRTDVAVLPGGPERLGDGHRPRRRGRPRDPHPTACAIQLGLRANLAQFSLLVAVNALVGGMLGQERTVLPLLADRGVRPPRLHRRADLHRRLRHRQGRHQLLRRHPVGPVRPQARPGRRLAGRPARAAAADLGADAGAGSSPPTSCSASTRA